ncbi:enoyl-CoA hydratase/isomerase [Lentinula aff. lateritia]|uniref:Enoyl-CoA hydratase/isomerase n=1 Tax=Lentinula aff. lateritia TaxID=2804960 RepID=A0ACC1TJJ3_9AGAR|nr:enoyl-CoA hydratase/isomerase [Lentinula aff. lateritia]
MNNLSSKWIKVSEPFPHVLLVELARFWKAYGALFDAISEETSDVRAVVLSSAFPDIFSAGLDCASLTSFHFSDYQTLFTVLEAGDIAKATADADPQSTDAARIALDFKKQIKPFQEAITAPERCLFPVIAAVHGMVVGLGVDIISACDIRYAASNTRFTIKEIDIGLAADMGTLAYLPKITGNMSFIREMAYTTQWFSASKAEQIGLVSKVVEGGKEEVDAAALELAQLIVTKSPIAVTGTKRLLSHARDHSVAENLEYTSLWNSAMLQTKDMMETLVSNKAKRPGEFLPLNFKFGKSKL